MMPVMAMMSVPESMSVPEAAKVMAPMADNERQVEPVPAVVAAVVPVMAPMNLLHQTVFGAHRARRTDRRCGSE